MSSAVTGVVTNGVIVPSMPLPEGAQVEIQVKNHFTNLQLDAARHLTASELRRLPRQERQAILAAAAALAEEDYRSDNELTAFKAFSEEEMNDDETDAG